MNVVDTEAAAVVRRIFESAMGGMGTGEIARMLNGDGVLSPSAYYRRNHPDSGKFGYASEKNFWTGSAVWQILGRYAYTGASVGHLRELAAPCSKKSAAVKREDWIVVPGMQQAIVSKEEFELAQKAVKKTGRPRASGRDYPLKSLVVCGNCGRKMVRYGNIKRFKCPYGRNGGDVLCGKHRSPVEADMERIVFKAVQQYVDMVEVKRKSARGMLAGRKVKIQSDMESLSGLKGKVEALKKEKLRLYERYCGGEIDRSRYLAEKEGVDFEIGGCEEKIREMEAEVEAMEAEIAEGGGGERDAVCRLFLDEKELTYDMAHAFVEKILVYQEERVEIIWKFKDVYGEG